MSDNKKTTKTPPELFNIEELKEKNNTPETIFQGVKAAEDWKTGKAVTEEDYKKALNNFLKSPMGGKKVGKNA